MSPKLPLESNAVVLGDNLPILQELPDACVDLIYIDPPFNTGHTQTRERIRTVIDEDGDRKGFKGKTYRTEKLGSEEYADNFDDFAGFLAPRLDEAYRILKPNGSLFFHIDYRESHYCKVQLDGVFGRESFMNEIVWAYDYGARTRKKWPAKHDTIFWYAKNPKDYTYNFDAMDRIPYMAPGLVSPEKREKGKTPTDVWWLTIVPTNGPERTGYPTQKPIKLLQRIIDVHSNEGDRILDFFGGSGTTGAVAGASGRKFWLMDRNPNAIEIMRNRLSDYLE